MGLNSISIDGRLVRDAEVRMSQAGKAYTNIRIAFDRWNKSKQERESSFISVRVFKDLPLKKGQAVVIRGELEIREFEKDGQQVTWPQIVAHECYPIQYVKIERDGGGGFQAGAGNVVNATNVFGGQPPAPSSSPPPPASFEDDIPF